MSSFLGDDPPDVVTLGVVVRELGALADRIHDQVVTAHSLVTVTDWQSRAAQVFHERAADWAGDVGRLLPLVDTARLAALDARERAAARHAWEATLDRLSGAVP